MSRLEELLNSILDGDIPEDFVPQSRAEAYLLNCCKKCGCEGLPVPQSRADALMYRLAEVMAGGGGTPEKIASSLTADADMATAEFIFGNESFDVNPTHECGMLSVLLKEDSGTSGTMIITVIYDMQEKCFISWLEGFGDKHAGSGIYPWEEYEFSTMQEALIDTYSGSQSQFKTHAGCSFDVYDLELPKEFVSLFMIGV